MSKCSNKRRLKQLRNWLDNEVNFKKGRNMYRIKMDGNQPNMEKLSQPQLKKLRGKKTSTVQLDLSNHMLEDLKKFAGIRNDVSGKAIVLAAITKAIGSL